MPQCVEVAMVCYLTAMASRVLKIFLILDVMMFLNVAVAITCFVFCWTLGVVGFKGWLRSRANPAIARRIAA